jgi:hypothetical protein
VGFVKVMCLAPDSLQTARTSMDVVEAAAAALKSAQEQRNTHLVSLDKRVKEAQTELAKARLAAQSSCTHEWSRDSSYENHSSSWTCAKCKYEPVHHPPPKVGVNK